MEILTHEEKKAVNKCAKNGYYIFDIKNIKILKNIKKEIAKEAKKILKLKIKDNNFFNYTQNYVENNLLNLFRLCNNEYVVKAF